MNKTKSMFVMVGDEVLVEDLLKGIIIASGNDACIALAMPCALQRCAVRSLRCARSPERPTGARQSRLGDRGRTVGTGTGPIDACVAIP